MENFNAFKEAFEEKYGKGNVSEFIYESEKSNPELPFGATLVANLDEEAFDSYGNEDSTLERVFTIGEFGDIHVMFYGSRQSYNGEDWDGMKEVKPTQKMITVYE